jgi:hypothetical protein
MFRTEPGFESEFESGFDPGRIDANCGAGFRFRLRLGLYALRTASEWNLGFVADAVRFREQLSAEEQLDVEPAAPKWVQPGSTQPARQTAVAQRKTAKS